MSVVAFIAAPCTFVTIVERIWVVAIPIFTRLVAEVTRRGLLVDFKVSHESVHYFGHFFHFHADIERHRVTASRTRGHVHVRQFLLQLGKGL